MKLSDSREAEGGVDVIGPAIGLGWMGLLALICALVVQRRRKRIQREPLDDAAIERSQADVKALDHPVRKKRAQERLAMATDWRYVLRIERAFFAGAGCLLVLAAIVAFL